MNVFVHLLNVCLFLSLLCRSSDGVLCYSCTYNPIVPNSCRGPVRGSADLVNCPGTQCHSSLVILEGLGETIHRGCYDEPIKEAGCFIASGAQTCVCTGTGCNYNFVTSSTRPNAHPFQPTIAVITMPKTTTTTTRRTTPRPTTSSTTTTTTTTTSTALQTTTISTKTPKTSPATPSEPGATTSSQSIPRPTKVTSSSHAQRPPTASGSGTPRVTAKINDSPGAERVVSPKMTSTSSPLVTGSRALFCFAILLSVALASLFCLV